MSNLCKIYKFGLWLSGSLKNDKMPISRLDGLQQLKESDRNYDRRKVNGYFY